MAKAQTETAETPAKPPKKRSQPAMTGSISFFQRVSRVPKDDWGPRASIKVYRLAPVLNLLLVQDHKFVAVYEQDGYTVNEQRLKQDCGSGRYKLYLNYKAPSEAEGKEVDSIVLDILDPEYPPNIPLGSWIDHPKNRDWQWAKEKLEAKQAAERAKNAPPAAPPPPTPVGEVAQLMGVVNDIQEGAAERARASQSQAPGLLDTIRAVKEILPPPPAASTENGMLNTIVTLFTTQMSTQSQLMQKQMEDARAETRELREELRRSRENPPNSKSGFDMFKEGLGLLKEVGPSLKEIWPGARGRLADALDGKSRMSGWQEFLVQFGQPILSDIINSPVTNALGQLIIMKAAQPAPQQNGGMGATITPQSPTLPQGRGPSNLVEFFNLVWPSFFHQMKDGATGDEFAAWLWDGYGSPYNGVDWLGQSKLAGPINIVNAFKQSSFWQQVVVLPNGEQLFTEFVTAFCGWNPPADDEIQEGDGPGDVVDLTAEEIGRTM